MKQVFFGLAAAMALAGCVSYTGAVTPGDDQVDEGNRAFAAKAAADYKQRQQFKRAVVIQEAPGINLFLSPTWVPRSNNARANAVCSNIETRRTIVQSAKARLREIVSGLRDLQLTGEQAPAMVEVHADDNTLPSVYVIRYNVSNLDLQLRESRGISLVRAASSQENKICYEWVANITVEINMIDPAGNSVFTFNAIGTKSQTDDGSLNPNMTMLEQATTEAVSKAMKQYAHKFGPPIYVTDTCQNGEFVRINAGSDYGVQKGMKVEFYRHRNKQGLDGTAEATEQRVGTGTVGEYDAPVERGCAWVHVDGYKDDAPRAVFQWTSVKLLKDDAESAFQLAIPNITF